MKTIASQNTLEIEHVMTKYRGVVEELQKLVDEVKESGITIDDQILQYLADSERFRVLTYEQVQQEAVKMQFALARQQYIESVKPLYEQIEVWGRRYQAAFSIGDTQLCRDYYAVKEGVVMLDEDAALQATTDRYTIYIDSEVKKTVQNKAQEIIEKLQALDDYLKQHGNVMRAVSGDLFMRTNGIIVIDNENHFRINTQGFAHLEAIR